MWTLLLPVLSILAGLLLGLLTMATAVVISVRIVDNLKSGRTLVGGSHRDMSENPLPFVIKDDWKEQQIEQEHLGYKPMEKFDAVEGLGR